MSIISFVGTAHAQDAAAASAPPSPLSGMIPLILIFVVFYFLLIRPQQKKYKQHQEMVSNVKRGDDVVTGGGIHGKVTKVEEGSTVMVQIAEGIEVKVEKSTISTVIAKPGAEAALPKAEKSAKKKKAANDNA